MNVYALSFSPTGNSRRCACEAAARLSPAFHRIDLTPFAARERSYSFEPGDLVFAALPVYGGRLPQLPDSQKPLLDCLHGNGAALCALVTYGNRAYDDALLELADRAEERGFRVVAAGAFVAPHSFSTSMGAGRPDDKDAAALAELADAFKRKVAAGDFSRPAIPGNRPYRVWSPAPFVPVPNDNCLSCGSCAELCPMDVIEHEPPYQAARPQRCIHCHACVKLCPVSGREIAQEAFHLKIAQLEAAFAGVRREAESFY